MSLFQWDRTKAGGYLDKAAYDEHAKLQQNSLRKALQLTPDTDSPWEKVQYQDWKDKITVIALSAVQKVAIAGVKSDNPLHWIYSPIAGVKGDNPLHWIYSPKQVDPNIIYRQRKDTLNHYLNTYI